MFAEKTQPIARPVPLKVIHNQRYGGNADDLVFPLLISMCGLFAQLVVLASGFTESLAGI